MVLAFVDAGSTLGVMAAGSLVPLAVTASSWRLGWMELGLMAVILGVFDFFMIRSYPASAALKTAPSGIPEKPAGPAYKKLFTDNRFWLIGLAYLLTGLAIMVPFTFISTFALQERSFSFDRAAGLVTIIGIGGLLGKVSLGPLSDKLGRVKIMLLCALLVTAGSIGIAYSRDWDFYASTAIFGAGYGACWSMYAAVSRPGRTRGT